MRTPEISPSVPLTFPAMATSDKKIILYDFPGKFPDGAWSPNVWKAR